MKILIPAQFFYPSRMGGPANALYWLARGLVHIGHSVTVISTTNGVEVDNVHANCWQDIDGIKVIYLRDRKKFSLRLAMKSILETAKYDAVIFSSIFYPPFLFIAMAAKIKKLKIIMSPRGELFDAAINGSKLKYQYLKLLRKILSYSCRFHATSEEELLKIKQYFGDDVKSVVLPNLMILPEKLVCRDEKDKYLLFMGRIAPIKALENLLRALELSDMFRSSDYRLKLAGPIDNEKYWGMLNEIIQSSELLRDKVEYLGVVSGKTKYQLYADAAFIVLPSHSENFGNVVIECLSQATPVIASKGTPWEVLNSSGAGIWTSNDPEKLSDAINEILSQASTAYEIMCEKAYYLSKNYDVFTNIGKWNDILTRSMQ